jgi:type IV secretion system protein VirB6
MPHSDLLVSLAALDGFPDLSAASGFGTAVFYSLIANYLDNEIVTAFNELLSRNLQMLTAIAGVVMAFWFWLQGWKIMSGRSRESMSEFFAESAKRVFILALAFSAAAGSSGAFYWLANDLPRQVNYLVTGQNGPPSSGIDKNLAFMQVALSSIDVLQSGGDEAVEDAKTRSMFFAAAGTAGPAVVGGAMLLLNKIALGLFVGFGPIFVLALAFDYTKPLFQKWLYYGLGTIFALVMLNLMIGIATEMVAKVAAALWVNNFASSLIGGGTEGITSRALQQGGLGLILTLLIVTTPPMAAAFFNGVMGQFQAYSAFQGGVGAGARGPGSPPAPGQQTVSQGYLGRTADTPPVDRHVGTVDPRVALGSQRIPEGAVPEPPGNTRQGAWRETPASNPTASALPSTAPSSSAPTISATLPPTQIPTRGPGP